MNNSNRNQAQVKARTETNRGTFERWGMPYNEVMDLGERLHNFHGRFHDCFATQTNNKSGYARVYLQGLLWMESKRNYTNIARRVIGPEDDGQGLQHFMSDSPWSGKKVFEQIQSEITKRPELSGGMLSLDESGVACSGRQKAGADWQYLGREGKVDLGQVSVGLNYYKDGLWSLVDAELYLPKSWFSEEYADLRDRWHVPPERTFQSKPALGLEMIKRAQKRGLPFETVSCDSLYGRDSQFRADLDQTGLTYMADIPENVQVYLEKPVVAVPKTPSNKRGRPYSRWRVVNRAQEVKVRDLEQNPNFVFQTVEVRYTERGWLAYACAAKRVYTITDRGQVRKEWLFIRQEKDGRTSYSLSNAPAETNLHTLALWRSQRYFVERTFQDAKSEAGWDELVARKYRAWSHHTALDALALWFIAETKLDWSLSNPRDPKLAGELGVDALPNLSMANIRELLRAALPLKRLTPDQAIRLVIQQLIDRARSTQCRLRAQQRSGSRGVVT
ncbi:MAG: IS701 family transposase [Anaerolineales bacterium]